MIPYSGGPAGSLQAQTIWQQIKGKPRDWNLVGEVVVDHHVFLTFTTVYMT